jgi:hypothetical protein
MIGLNKRILALQIPSQKRKRKKIHIKLQLKILKRSRAMENSTHSLRII